MHVWDGIDRGQVLCWLVVLGTVGLGLWYCLGRRP